MRYVWVPLVLFEVWLELAFYQRRFWLPEWGWKELIACRKECGQAWGWAFSRAIFWWWAVAEGVYAGCRENDGGGGQKYWEEWKLRHVEAILEKTLRILVSQKKLLWKTAHLYIVMARNFSTRPQDCNLLLYFIVASLLASSWFLTCQCRLAVAAISKDPSWLRNCVIVLL